MIHSFYVSTRKQGSIRSFNHSRSPWNPQLGGNSQICAFNAFSSFSKMCEVLIHPGVLASFLVSLLAPASSPLNVPIHGVQWSEKVGVLLSGRPAAFDPNGQDSDTAFTPWIFKQEITDSFEFQIQVNKHSWCSVSEFRLFRPRFYLKLLL